MTHESPTRTYPESPEALTIEAMRQPGIDYDHEHPQSKKVWHCLPENCLHHDYKEAKELSNAVIPDYTPEKGWRFLAEFICHKHSYLALNTAMGREIKKYFEKAFHFKIGVLEEHDVVSELYNTLELAINKYYHRPPEYVARVEVNSLDNVKLKAPTQPEQLTLEHVRAPGKLYLEKYPKKGIHRLFHTHQKDAYALSQVELNGTPKEQWEYLIRFLGSLYRVQSLMGKEIIHYFENAFKTVVPRPFDEEGNSIDKTESYRDHLVAFLSQKVNQYFEMSCKPQVT